MQAEIRDLTGIRVQRCGSAEGILHVTREELRGERVDLRYQVVNSLEFVRVQASVHRNLDAATRDRRGLRAAGARDRVLLAETDRDLVTVRRRNFQRLALAREVTDRPAQ